METITFSSMALDALALIVLCSIALGLIRLGSWQYFMLAPHDAEAVPLLHLLALTGGVLLGALLLASLPHAADFRLTRIYAPDSPWNMRMSEFLHRYTLPDPGTLREAVALLQPGRTDPAALIGQGGAMLALAAMVQAAVSWNGLARWRAIAAALVLTSWTALVVHYVVHLLAWGAVQLNFWAFAVALLLWQRWRYRNPQSGH